MNSYIEAMTTCPRCKRPGHIDTYGGMKMCFDCHSNLPLGLKHLLVVQEVNQLEASRYRRLAILAGAFSALMFVIWAVSALYRVTQ
jgi:hypothetical protein